MIAAKTEVALQQLIRTCQKDNDSVRVVGSGHSFVPLCKTDGVLINIDGLEGILSVDNELNRATVAAGSKLSSLGKPLLAAGLALQNMGDIDKQSLAGAVSTGTHGTGPALGSLSTQVVGLRLLNGSAELVDCSETSEPDLFKAAQVSLGALGIITRVTLQLLPAYRLHERSWTLPYEVCIEQLESLVGDNQRFEFFWLPSDDTCALKTLNPTELQCLPTDSLSPNVSKAAARYVQAERIDWSYRIFPSDRARRFNEQEFSVAAENGPECLRELRELMQTKHKDVQWPLEYRTVAADDIPLSPFYKRDSVTISVHQAADQPYQKFFKDTEAIFHNYQGRPHWGKIHSHKGSELEDLYPAWNSFHKSRESSDPLGIFMNDYLKQLFGSAESASGVCPQKRLKDKVAA